MVNADLLKKISLARIVEPDLADGISTKSGWYTLRYNSKLFHQICLRPDNRLAYEYLVSLGIVTGDELLNNGNFFLLPTNAYIQANRSQGVIPADYIPRMIPDEKPFTGMDTSSIGLYIAKHNTPRKRSLVLVQ